MKRKFIIIVVFVNITIGVEAQQVSPLMMFPRKIEKIKLDSIVNLDSFSTTPRVFFAGVAGTDALNLNSITASAGLTVGIQFSDRLKALVSYSLGGKILKSQSADSVPLSTIYFLDAGSSAFSGRLDWSLNKEYISIGKDNLTFCNFILGGDVSVGQKNISRDSISYGINILNYDIALRTVWSHHDRNEKNKLEFSLSALYCHVEVLPNSSQSFNAIFDNTVSKNKIVPKIYNGLGFIVESHINDFVLYFRSYVPFDTFLGKSSATGELAYTVGIKAAINWHSF